MIENNGKLEVKNISKIYDKKNIVLNNLSFDLNKGEIISILGPSGCGKTTLLNVLSGIVEADCGKIYLDGEDITCKKTGKRNIVVVSQENLLFPHMNVYDNVAFGLRARKIKESYIEKTVKELLEKVNLLGYENKNVNKLSGGQKQRISIIRALAVKPKILLLDEAFSSLDTNLREQMRNLTKLLKKEYGFSIILVTHDKSEAMSFGNKVAVLLKGKIEQIGSPRDIYEKPSSLNLAKFMFKENFIKNEDEIILVRPEDIKIEETSKTNINNLDGEIVEINYKGSYVTYYFKTKKGILKVNDYNRNKIFNLNEKFKLSFVKKTIFKNY